LFISGINPFFEFGWGRGVSFFERGREEGGGRSGWGKGVRYFKGGRRKETKGGRWREEGEGRREKRIYRLFSWPAIFWNEILAGFVPSEWR
jgi:hypothetical protein